MDQSDLDEIKNAQRRTREALFFTNHTSFGNDLTNGIPGDQRSTIHVETEGSGVPRVGTEGSASSLLNSNSFSFHGSPAAEPVPEEDMGSSRRIRRQRSRGLEARKRVASLVFALDGSAGELGNSSTKKSGFFMDKLSFSKHEFGTGVDGDAVSPAEGRELPSRRAQSNHQSQRHQPGAFSAIGRDARAQRKGILTPLEQNNRVPSFVGSSDVSDDEVTRGVNYVGIDEEQMDEKSSLISEGDGPGPVRNRRNLRFALVVVVFAVAASLALWRATAGRGSSSLPEIVEDPPSNIEYVIDFCSLTENAGKSFSPFLTQSFIEQLEERHAALTAELTSDVRNVTVCSPQSLAILHETALEADTNTSVLVRYGLTVFFYSTNGHQWKNEHRKWLSVGTNHCDWYGITCSDSNELTALNLKRNQLEGVFPSEIFLLTDLKSIDLHFNELKGTIPGEIGNLSSLHTLKAGANYLSGTFPSEIARLAALEYIDVGANPLADEIGSVLGLFGPEKLTYLSLSRLSLTGSIPTEIGHLSNLRTLKLLDNVLESSLPSEIGLLSNLVDLDASGNALTGWLPSEIGYFTALEHLALNDNHLSGSIPSEIGLLTSLTRLVLSVNQLSGSIPSEISNLSNMEHLNFNHLPNLFGSLEGFCQNAIHDSSDETTFHVYFDLFQDAYLVDCPCCDPLPG